MCTSSLTLASFQLHHARSNSPESQIVLYSRSLRSISHCVLFREPAENPPHPRLAPRQTILHPAPLTNSRFYARTFLNMKQVLGDTRRAASLGVYNNWGEECGVLRCSWRRKRVGGGTGNKYPRGENLDALSPQQTRVQRRQGNTRGSGNNDGGLGIPHHRLGIIDILEAKLRLEWLFIQQFASRSVKNHPSPNKIGSIDNR